MPGADAGRRLRTGAVLALYLVLSFLSFDQIEEDAYIYFRVAENLAAGEGYVFNRGGPPVESGSSALWQLLLVPLAWLPVEIVLWAKLLGIACGALALWLTARLGEALLRDPWVSHVPALLTALSLPFLRWCQMGLETPLYTAVVLWLAWVLVDERRARSWALPACALFVARPEGLALCLALLPALLVRRRRLRDLWRPALGVGAFVLAGTLLRVAYFHDVVPHPFYLKMKVSAQAGAGRLHGEFLAARLYLLLAPLALVVWRRRFWSAGMVAVGSLLALLLAWNLTVSEFPGYQRHLVPALPLLYLAAVRGFEAVAELVPARSRALLHGLCLAGLALTAPLPRAGQYGPDRELVNPVGTALGELAARPASYARSVERKLGAPSASPPVAPPHRHSIGHNYQARIGRFLARNYPRGAVVVYDQMGQTPYYAGHGFVFIDSFGLTDRAAGFYAFSRRLGSSATLRLYERLVGGLLAHEKRYYDAREIADHLFEREPHLVLIHQLIARGRYRSGPHLLQSDPRLRERYVRRFLLAGWVVLYERADLPRRTPSPIEDLEVVEF
jgi:hypothetical protein